MDFKSSCQSTKRKHPALDDFKEGKEEKCLNSRTSLKRENPRLDMLIAVRVEQSTASTVRGSTEKK